MIIGPWMLRSCFFLLEARSEGGLGDFLGPRGKMSVRGALFPVSRFLHGLMPPAVLGGAYQVFDFCFQCFTNRFEGLSMLLMPQCEHRTP